MDLTQLTQIAADTVGAAQRQLPPEIRPLAREVTVHYEEAPGEDVLADGFPPDILGLFTGYSHGTELNDDKPLMEAAPLPPRIHLYVANLWDMAEKDLDVFREEVRITYLHELGHYLGWDEDQVSSRGLE